MKEFSARIWVVIFTALMFSSVNAEESCGDKIFCFNDREEVEQEMALDEFLPGDEELAVETHPVADILQAGSHLVANQLEAVPEEGLAPFVVEPAAEQAALEGNEDLPIFVNIPDEVEVVAESNQLSGPSVNLMVNAVDRVADVSVGGENMTKAEVCRDMGNCEPLAAIPVPKSFNAGWARAHPVEVGVKPHPESGFWDSLESAPGTTEISINSSVLASAEPTGAKSKPIESSVQKSVQSDVNLDQLVIAKEYDPAVDVLANEPGRSDIFIIPSVEFVKAAYHKPVRKSKKTFKWGFIENPKNLRQESFNEFMKVVYPFFTDPMSLSAEHVVSVILAESEYGYQMGGNIGKCRWNKNHRGNSIENMRKKDIWALRDITSELGLDMDEVSVSCKGNGSKFGGAMGPGQIMPATWLMIRDEVARVIGVTHAKYLNPFNNPESFLGAVVYLQKMYKTCKGSTVEREFCSAAKYFAGPGKGWRIKGHAHASVAAAKKMSLVKERRVGDVVAMK